ATAAASQQRAAQREWVTSVNQSCYGYQARKATWLLYVGAAAPPALDWRDLPGTHQVGWADARGKSRNKPTLSSRSAELTPPQFAELLVSLAAHGLTDVPEPDTEHISRFARPGRIG